MTSGVALDRRRNRFAFREQLFENVVAHDGKGRIRTARVAEFGQFQGFNFIDLTELPPGTSIGRHTHSECDEEVYVIISGHGRMTADGEEFLVHPGDVIVNPAGGTHGLENTGDACLRIVVLCAPV
jgi:mannose-6-phosphate isomerase-like protein (cupin superfamily)